MRRQGKQARSVNTWQSEWLKDERRVLAHGESRKNLGRVDTTASERSML